MRLRILFELIRLCSILSLSQKDDVVNWVARRQAEPLLRLKFDNTTKRVPVSAVGRHITASAFQSAMGLSGVHDEFIQFLGVRAENGDEILFETSEDLPEPHLPNWEEVWREDQTYTILYVDSREEMGKLLTEAERQQIVDEFDEIDGMQKDRAGIVTPQDIQTWCANKVRAQVAALREEREKLESKGDAGKRAADERERLIREKAKQDLGMMLQTDVDEDGSIELHEFFRTRTQQILAARGALPAVVKPGAGVSTLSGPSDFCPNCGKQYISAFCTGCGTPRDAEEASTSPERRQHKGAKKKGTLKKGALSPRKGAHGNE